MSGQKRSLVWDHFDVKPDDDTLVKCKHCKESISRGGKEKSSFNTSNMKLHLQRRHKNQFHDMVQKEATNKPPADEPSAAKLPRSTQPTLLAIAERQRPWGPDDPRTRHMNRLLTEMIALDDEPFRIVKKVQTLLCKYIYIHIYINCPRICSMYVTLIWIRIAGNNIVAVHCTVKSNFIFSVRLPRMAV